MMIIILIAFVIIQQLHGWNHRLTNMPASRAFRNKFNRENIVRSSQPATTASRGTCSRHTFVIKSGHDDQGPDFEAISEHPEEASASSIFISDVSRFGINTALAEEHISLGNFERAKELAEGAMEAARHRNEANNIYGAYAEGILGDALFKMGLYEEAAIHYKSALKAYERHSRSSSGPEAIELVGALQLMAWNCLASKQFEDAKIAGSDALEMTERLLGPNATDVAACLVNLAIAHMETNDISVRTETFYSRALGIYEQALRDFDSSLGPERRAEYLEAIALIHSSLGNLHHLRMNDTRAEEEYRKVLHMYNSGQYNTPHAAASLTNLGLLLWKKGDLRHAEINLARALMLIEGSDEYGPTHPQVAIIKRQLGELRSDPGYMTAAAL